jgi:DNA-binding NarL/FixJ family response regulator
VTKARILLGDLPRMTRDILEGQIAAQADMQVVGRCDDAGLERAVRQSAANVVILHERSGDGTRQPWLVEACRDLTFVVIRDEGRNARLHECRSINLVDVSPDTLLEAIRHALQGRDAIVG